MRVGMFAALAAGLVVAAAGAMTRDGDPAASGGLAPGQLIPHEDPVAIARGADLYGAHCAACHGENLEGEVPDWRAPGPDGLLPAPPHDETGHTWHHPDALLVDIVARGTEAVVGGDYRSAMIGFADILTPDEILATLAYIKSNWPPHIVEAHDGVNARAAAFGD